MIKKIGLATLFVIGLTISSQPSMAVTIAFGQTDVDPYVENGFTIDIARIVNGNCSIAPCMALNSNETSTLSRVGGGVFTLDSFWFQLLGNGNPNQLTVTSYLDSAPITTVHLAVPTYTHNVGYVYSTDFADITSIVFDTTGGGNVRIDNMNLLIASADVPLGHSPLPAALPLFATGLGVMGWLGWRRKRKNAAALAAA